ncbi:unnamed protein product [Rotaria sp. Silwood1]|nr:unnamed protein product [Rotaria sp. Silwood1]
MLPLVAINSERIVPECGLAAVLLKTASAPIDRVLLLVRNQGEMIKQGVISRPYSGIIDCTVRTIKSDGLLPFWRGNVARCIRYFPMQALHFALNEKIKTMLKYRKNNSHMKNLAINVSSGSVAGMLPWCFLYPVVHPLTRLADDRKNVKKGGERKYNGLLDVYKKTLQSDGIVGLYRGFVLPCVGHIIYYGCYFGVYGTLKPILLGPDGSIILSFLLGYSVAVTSHLISYPVDKIRLRMMMTSGQAVKYKGSLDCMIQILCNEGVGALFKGVGVKIIPSVAGGAMLASFDKLVQLYTGVKFDTNTN